MQAFSCATVARALMIACLIGMAGVVTPVSAQVPAGARATQPLPPVEVRALRDPVEKSYRRIVRGMDLFERRHALAPEASLRFKLLPRRRDTDMDAVALRIVGDTVSIPVPLAADNTFTLGRFAQALAEDAAVSPDRRAGSLTWRAEIRTPGLPPDTRRLGDLRLECLVGIESGLVSDNRPSLLGELARLIGDRGYCDQRDPHYLFFADRALWSVTLVDGARREVLSVDRLYAGVTVQPMSADDLHHCDCEVLLDRTYYAPLSDPAWSDETRLEFEYMDDAAPREVP